MKHFLLLYDYVPDFMERRAPLRAEHLSLLRALEDRGELIVGGAFVGAPEGAAVLFKCEDASVVERFVASDPYVKNGIVTRWSIREWTTVVGEIATNPALRS